MNEQQFFNIAVVLISGLGGWLLRIFWQRLDEQEKRQKEANELITELRISVSGDYVTRNELALAVGNLGNILQRIEDKLDRKQDK